MNNTKVLEEFFIWEENNSTDLKMKLENKIESEQKDSMINTKIVNEYENWKTITDPKLRKKMRDKNWREVNKDKIIKYRKTNKEYYLNYNKKYREINKDKMKECRNLWKKTKGKKYREINKDKINETKRNYRKKNKIKINEYEKNRIKNDIQFKLKKLLRKRFHNALKGNFKSGSAVKDLGCTIPELKTYLESKFHPDMNWHNHGEWHIDHINPLSSFDLTDRQQFLEACHYTNLQPLWAIDNLSKGAKTV